MGGSFRSQPVFTDLVLAAVMSVFAKIWGEHSTETIFYENQNAKLKIQRTLKIQIPRRWRIRRIAESPEYMDQASRWMFRVEASLSCPTPPRSPETDTSMES